MNYRYEVKRLVLDGYDRGRRDFGECLIEALGRPPLAGKNMTAADLQAILKSSLKELPSVREAAATAP